MTVQIRGKDSPLDADTVKLLEAQNPETATAERVKKTRATRLAYDRRVDVVILPAAVESVKYYPHQASDSALLFTPHWLGESKVHRASE